MAEQFDEDTGNEVGGNIPGTVAANPGNGNPVPYVELAKLCQQSYDIRRSYEWKVMFGLWTGIGLCTWFVVQNNSVISESTVGRISTGYKLVFFTWLFAWPSIHVANAFDVTCRNYYQMKAERLPTKANPLVKDKRNRKTLGLYWRHQRQEYKKMFARNPIMWAQIVATGAFVMLSVMLMQDANKTGNSDHAPKHSDTVIERTSRDTFQLIINKIPGPDQKE